jgi:hypothetical protein
MSIIASYHAKRNLHVYMFVCLLASALLAYQSYAWR